MQDCVFCKIVKGQIPAHKIWENEDYLAFLSIQPQAEGMTIVIPKAHHRSYFAAVDEDIMCGVISAARRVAKLLDSKLKNIIRSKLVFEGLEVDHLHAKLIPMYQGKSRGGDINKPLDQVAKQITR